MLVLNTVLAPVKKLGMLVESTACQEPANYLVSTTVYLYVNYSMYQMNKINKLNLLLLGGLLP